MFYAKFTDREGCYMDADGVRFSISSARRVRSPQGVNVGYEEFPSLEDALAAWGLRVCSDEMPDSPGWPGLHDSAFAKLC